MKRSTKKAAKAAGRTWYELSDVEQAIYKAVQRHGLPMPPSKFGTTRFLAKLLAGQDADTLAKGLVKAGFLYVTTEGALQCVGR